MKTQTQRFSREVLVIDESGQNRGSMPYNKARELADEAGLDLVEVSKQGDKSVCRVMDEGKWKYEQKKRASKSKQHTPTLKEMKFRLTTERHDLDVKLGHIKKFLAKGHSVKIVVQLRGREKANPDLAKEKLDTIISEIGEDVKVDSVKKNPGLVHTIVHPKK